MPPMLKRPRVSSCLAPHAPTANSPSASTTPDSREQQHSIPTPFEKGDHVLCPPLPPSPSAPVSPPVRAVIIALDEEYREAAAAYRATHPIPTSPTSPPHSESKHDQQQQQQQQQRAQSSNGSSSDLVDLTLEEDDDDNEDEYKIKKDRSHNTRRNKRGRPKKKEQPFASPLSPPSSPPACKSETFVPIPHPALAGRVYLHFIQHDKRLDRWVTAMHLQRAPPPSPDDDENNSSTLGPRLKARKLTRAQKRAYDQANPSPHAGIATHGMGAGHGDPSLDAATLGMPGAAGAIGGEETVAAEPRRINSIVLGGYVIDAWYSAPFLDCHEGASCLYMCQHCLKIMRSSRHYSAHRQSCLWRSPPGAKIYEDSERGVSVYEVCGVLNERYCQNLCLLGKLFLDHKTLHFDVGPFMFYVVVRNGELAAFFSKQKSIVPSDFNLACIVTLPPHQRVGLGRFMIALSYELTRREGKTGSPERPLSDLGQVSYRTYWTHAIIRFIKSSASPCPIPVKEVAAATAICVPDVIAVLKELNILHLWKNENFAQSPSHSSVIAAQHKAKPPVLPFLPELLETTIYDISSTEKVFSTAEAAQQSTKARRSKKKADKPPRTPNSAITKPSKSGSKAKGSAKSSSKGSGKSTKSSSKGTGKANVGSASKTPTIAPTPAPSSASKVGRNKDIEFSKYQLDNMRAFVLEYGPHTVLAPSSSNKGLPAGKMSELAIRIGATHDRCCSKIRAIAKAMLLTERQSPPTQTVARGSNVAPPQSPPRVSSLQSPPRPILSSIPPPPPSSGSFLDQFTRPMLSPLHIPPRNRKKDQQTPNESSIHIAASTRLSSCGNTAPPAYGRRQGGPRFHEPEQRNMGSSSAYPPLPRRLSLGSPPRDPFAGEASPENDGRPSQVLGLTTAVTPRSPMSPDESPQLGGAPSLVEDDVPIPDATLGPSSAQQQPSRRDDTHPTSSHEIVESDDALTPELQDVSEEENRASRDEDDIDFWYREEYGDADDDTNAVSGVPSSAGFGGGPRTRAQASFQNNLQQPRYQRRRQSSRARTEVTVVRAPPASPPVLSNRDFPSTPTPPSEPEPDQEEPFLNRAMASHEGMLGQSHTLNNRNPNGTGTRENYSVSPTHSIVDVDAAPSSPEY